MKNRLKEAHKLKDYIDSKLKDDNINISDEKCIFEISTDINSVELIIYTRFVTIVIQFYDLYVNINMDKYSYNKKSYDELYDFFYDHIVETIDAINSLAEKLQKKSDSDIQSTIRNKKLEFIINN